jgi:hypothetical protein
MAWRTLSRERRSTPNELRDATVVRGRAVCLTIPGARVTDALNGETSGADTAASSKPIGGAAGALVKGGGGGPSGVVTSGDNGRTKLRLTFRGGVGCCGVTTRRGLTGRGFTGGGGAVPAGTPRASKNRRTRSSSLSAGPRLGGSSARGLAGFSDLSDA